VEFGFTHPIYLNRDPWTEAREGGSVFTAFNAPTLSIGLPPTTGLLPAGWPAAASGQGSSPGRGRANSLTSRPPFLHADGNLLGQAVFTLEWRQ